MNRGANAIVIKYTNINSSRGANAYPLFSVPIVCLD